WAARHDGRVVGAVTTRNESSLRRRCMHMDHGLATALDSAIASLDVIDCHEHTFLPDQRPQPMDLWSVLRDSNLVSDLMAAGMPAAERPLLDWARASPYLPAVRTTGFYRSLLLAFRDLFAFAADDLTSANWQPLLPHPTGAGSYSAGIDHMD